MEFDIEAFRRQPMNPQETSTKTTAASKPAFMDRTDLFIARRLPLIWLQKAHQLPGNTALPLGLSLWFQAGLDRRRNDLRLTAKFKSVFKLKDRSVTTALNALEAAELITVLRAPGKCVLVTILDVSGEES